MTDDDPKIGKHVLDLLTTGMYKEPRLIYREYIQNSADQIDLLSPDEKADASRCIITIDIDRIASRVKVMDTATGVPAKDFKARLLNVADSWKDPLKDKGFRGIGRLAGLAYCHKLIFETSAKGEKIVSRMEMDGDEMRKILRDKKDKCSASELIKRISTITQNEGDIPEYKCYFQVTLEGVIPGVGGGLLEVDDVRDLLGQIAPIDFSRTVFKERKDEIDSFAAKIGYPIQTYSISINGQTLVKPYKTNIKGRTGAPEAKVEDIVFKKFVGQKGRILGWAWAAVPDQGKQIVESTNPERMMRLRKDNIQIGMHDFFQGTAPDGGMYFPELRSNGYMLGEVHIVDPTIRPNADRNNLEVSEEANKFLMKLKETLFADLWGAAKEGNALSKARENIVKYITELSQKGPKIEDVSLPFEGRRKLAGELESMYKSAMNGLETLKKAKAKVKGEPDDESAIDLVRYSKTRDLDELAAKVVKPPLVTPPVETPKAGPDTPFPSPPPLHPPHPRPRPGTKPDPKPIGPVFPPPPSLGDKVVKILVDSGLDVEAAIEAWKQIEPLVS